MRPAALHVILFIALLCRTKAVPSYFMPFAGSLDTEAPQNDDSSTGPLTLNCLFNMFGTPFDTIWVNTNGALSFEGHVSDFSPDLFPTDESSMVAPYWSDVDTRNGLGPGRVYYRETTDAADLALIQADVNAALADVLGSFCPIWAFVATWNDVTHYGGNEYTPRSTFQVVLAQDEDDRAVAYFNYGELSWTVGTASNNDAVAGYYVDDAAQHHVNLPDSLTPNVVNLLTTSNVGMPGRWFFPLCADCTPPPVECWTCDWTSGNPNDPITVVEQLCNDQASKVTCADGEVCLTRLKCNDEHIPRPGQSTSGAQIVYRLKKECAPADSCDADSWLDGFLYKNNEKNLVVSKCCDECGCCNEHHGAEIDFDFGNTNPNAPVVHTGQGFPNGRYFCSF